MTRDGKISIVIDVDGKQISLASKELDGLASSAEDSGKNVNSATNSMDHLGDASNASSKQVKGVKDGLDDVGDSSTDASKGLKGAANATDDLADSAGDGAKQLKGVADSADNASDSAGDIAKNVGGARDSLDALSDSASDTAKAVNGAADSTDNLSDSVSDTAKATKAASGANDQYSDSAQSVTKSAQGAAGANDQLADSASGVEKAVKGAGDKASEAADKLKGVDDTSASASFSVKDLAMSFGLVKVASVAFDVMAKSIDGAVSRFDTLNQFPKVLEAMGVSAEDAELSMAKLSDGIDGLPTTLDEIASNAQRMYTSFGDMDKATDTTVALNNALLGSGSNSAKAQRGVEQYMRALQRGQMDMTIWSTLSETMDVGLVKIAESFGFAGAAAKDDLYSALKDGHITLDEFNDKLIEVGTGTGVMAELAKENSLGVATSFGNLQTAAVRGMANVIDAVNDLSKAVTGNDIAQNIDSMKGVVTSAFGVMTSSIQRTTPVFVFFGNTVSAVTPTIKALSPVLIGMGTAFSIHSVISKTTEALKKSKTATAAATAVKKTYTAAVNFSTAAIAKQQAATGSLTAITKTQSVVAIANATATKAMAVAKGAYNAVVAPAALLTAVLTGQITASTAATILKTKATIALETAMKLLQGPTGWATLAIGALAGAAVGLVKWFNRSTDEAKAFEKATAELAKETDKTIDATKSSAEAHRDNMSEINGSAAANSNLAKRIQELAEKENKSAGEKLYLKDMIDSLNESAEGLNLTYDEQSDSLNKTAVEMQSYIDTAKKQAEVEAINQRLIELQKERMQLEEQQAEFEKKATEITQDGNITQREKEKLLGEVNEKLEEVGEAHGTVGDKINEYGVKASEVYDDIAQSSEESAATQQTALIELSETQEAAIASMQSRYDELYTVATNAFEKMNTESKVSADQMLENLKHNQQAIATWGENVAKLQARAGKEGNEEFLAWLSQLGPESAGEIAVMTEMSEEQFNEMVGMVNNSGELTTKAFNDSLGPGFDESIEAFKEFGQTIPKTLQDELEAADMNSIGRAVVEGYTQGIDENAGQAEESVREMAKFTIDSAREVLAVNSPSKVFEEIGHGVPEGTALGVSNGTNSAVDAVRQMCQQMEQEAQNSAQNMSVNFNQVVTGADSALSQLPGIATKNMTAMNASFQSGSQTQQATMRTLNTALIRTFSNTPNQFQSIGRNIMSRMNAAMQSEANRVITTARNTANRTVQAFDRTPGQMQIVGSTIMRRLNSGMQSGSSVPVTTASRTSGAIVSAFNGLSGQMNSVGRSAMAGLDAGLNAGAGAVIATADRIANQVAATMKSALDINSPSKVMANEVGRWIPEGIAAGIEEYAGVAYQAIDNLSAGMLKITTPEVALGSARIGRELSNEKISQTIVHQSSSIDMAELARVLNSRPIKVNSILDGEKVSSTFDQSLGRQMYKRQYTGGVGFA